MSVAHFGERMKFQLPLQACSALWTGFLCAHVRTLASLTPVLHSSWNCVHWEHLTESVLSPLRNHILNVSVAYFDRPGTHSAYPTLVNLLFTADSTLTQTFCTEELLGLTDETKQLAFLSHITWHRVGPSASSTCQTFRCHSVLKSR